MKYEVRVQNRHAPDVVFTDVEEGDVSNIVTSWCSRGYGCIVTPKRSWGDEISKSSEKKPKCDWSCKEALEFANTLANHGWTGEANADAASSCIYALCRLLKDCGNAAALREALRLCREEMCDICDNEKPCKLKCVHVGIIDRALSDPPRNCDRFKTWEEAGNAWEKEGLHLPLIKWLFAAAKEGVVNDADD